MARLMLFAAISAPTFTVAVAIAVPIAIPIAVPVAVPVTMLLEVVTRGRLEVFSPEAGTLNLVDLVLAFAEFSQPLNLELPQAGRQRSVAHVHPRSAVSSGPEPIV